MGVRKEQVVVFGSMFVGYALYILCRKSFSFLVPIIMDKEALSNEDMGLIVSAQNSAYAISKFLVGVLSDRVSARMLFSLGLLGAATSLLGFASVASLPLFAFLWFGNGLMAGAGWPAASKLLRFWFRPDQFGTVWSLLSASMNVTGGLVPLCLPFLLDWSGGWRGVMFNSGLISAGWAAVCYVTISNSPEEQGLSPIGEAAGKEKKAAAKGKEGKGKSQEKQAGWGDLLSSPFLWLLCLYYLVVFGTRTCVENWAQLLLVRERDVVEAAAGQFLSAYEIGGFVSSLLTGYLTDWAVAKKSGKGGNPRMAVGTLYMAGGAICIQFLLSTTTQLGAQAFLLGAFLYGNINIIGIVATESAPPGLAGSSHAVVALAGSLGAVVAGLPLTFVASSIGWSGVFFSLEMAAAVCAVLMLVWELTQSSQKTKKD